MEWVEIKTSRHNTTGGEKKQWSCQKHKNQKHDEKQVSENKTDDFIFPYINEA